MSLQDAALTIEFYVEAQLRLSMWNRLRKIIAEKMDRFCSWRAKVCLNKFYMNDIEACTLSTVVMSGRVGVLSGGNGAACSRTRKVTDELD